jgi:hypothetical protein
MATTESGEDASMSSAPPALVADAPSGIVAGSRNRHALDRFIA